MKKMFTSDYESDSVSPAVAEQANGQCPAEAVEDIFKKEELAYRDI